ncbi:MAG: hypothetical protein SGI86_18875, partial [Deltaproteobacteria bacterium]|nr:hypothetical protein [Deltaproteobacteria bacterium]
SKTNSSTTWNSQHALRLAPRSSPTAPLFDRLCQSCSLRNRCHPQSFGSIIKPSTKPGQVQFTLVENTARAEVGVLVAIARDT